MRDKPNEWVSIADLMAGVVGVVILLFVIMAVMKQRADAAAASGAQAERQEVVNEIASKLKSQFGNYQISVSKDGISLPSQEMFEADKIDLTQPKGEAIAEALLRSTAAVLPCYVKGAGVDGSPDGDSAQKSSNGAPTYCARGRPIFAAVLIEGHADSAKAKGGCDNWCLSTGRARTVFNVAKKLQPALLRLRNADDQPLFGLAGYGDTRPLQDHNIPTNDARQRRVEIHFILDPLERR